MAPELAEHVLNAFQPQNVLKQLHIHRLVIDDQNLRRHR